MEDRTMKFGEIGVGTCKRKKRLLLIAGRGDRQK